VNLKSILCKKHEATMSYLRLGWTELRLCGARGFFLLGIFLFAVALWAFSELFFVHQLEFAAGCLLGLGGLALQFEFKAMDRIEAFTRSSRGFY
jgi:hypothetical protein